MSGKIWSYSTAELDTMPLPKPITYLVIFHVLCFHLGPDFKLYYINIELICL